MDPLQKSCTLLNSTVISYFNMQPYLNLELWLNIYLKMLAKQHKFQSKWDQLAHWCRLPFYHSTLMTFGIWAWLQELFSKEAFRLDNFRKLSKDWFKFDIVKCRNIHGGQEMYVCMQVPLKLIVWKHNSYFNFLTVPNWKCSKHLLF